MRNVSRKGHLGDETPPILPMPPILVPFAIVSRDAMGEGVGSRPHDGPRPPSVRSSHPVSIKMPDSLIEELPRDVSRLASWCFTLLEAAETKEAHGGFDEPVVQRLCGT